MPSRIGRLPRHAQRLSSSGTRAVSGSGTRAVKFRYPCRAWEGTWEELSSRPVQCTVTCGFATGSGPLTSTQPRLAVDGILHCRGGGFLDG